LLRKIATSDIESLIFEIGQLFTPSSPIKLTDLFAGRQKQISQMIDGVAEPGRHLVLYGERGTGKTSLSQVLEFLVPTGKQSIYYLRKSCSPSDTFDTIWRKFFKDMQFSIRNDTGLEEVHRVDEVHKAPITPDDVLREMKMFGANDVPIFVIDEFNEVSAAGAANALANTISRFLTTVSRRPLWLLASLTVSVNYLQNISQYRAVRKKS